MKFGFRCSEGDARFSEAVEEARHGEAVGFDSVWLSEHVGLRHHWASPHLVHAALAAETESIQLGTSVVLLPQTHPVRLAAEVDMVDHLSSGRFVLGVGAGWRESEMENLGWGFDTRGPRMTDHLRALHELWDSPPASFDGRHYGFDDVTLSPPPLQDPHPPLWVGGTAEPALKRAAYLGDTWFPVWKHSVEELGEMYATYEAYVEEAGDDPARRPKPLMRYVVVHEDERVVEARIRELFEFRYQESLEPERPGLPDRFRVAAEGDLDALPEGWLVAGTPDDCIRDVEHLQSELGVDHLVLRLFNPGVIDHEEVMASLDLLAAEVLPSF